MFDLTMYDGDGKVIAEWESEDELSVMEATQVVSSRHGTLVQTNRETGEEVMRREFYTDMSVSERFKDARAFAGWSQSECSKAIGIPLKTLQAYEGGYRKPAPWMVDILIDYIYIRADEEEYQREQKKKAK